jgi:hypothetical protein
MPQIWSRPFIGADNGQAALSRQAARENQAGKAQFTGQSTAVNETLNLLTAFGHFR